MQAWAGLLGKPKQHLMAQARSLSKKKSKFGVWSCCCCNEDIFLGYIKFINMLKKTAENKNHVSPYFGHIIWKWKNCTNVSKVLDMCWTHYGHLLDTFGVWTHFGHIMDTSNVSIGQLFRSTEHLNHEMSGDEQREPNKIGFMLGGQLCKKFDPCTWHHCR